MLKREKMLISLVLVTLVVLFGSISSFATDITSGNNTAGTITITASNGNNTTNNATNNTNTNTISGTVNAVSNNTTGNNTSKYNNTTTNSTKLPYAGSNSSVVFIVLAFAASAVYAYKKVSDYNV